MLAVWIAAAAGWGVIAAGLRGGLSGYPRRIALVVHVLTPAALVLLPAFLGFGHLYAWIAVTAEWWALAAVTGLRPERLVLHGDLGRLAAWAALTGLTSMIVAALVL